MKRECEGWTQFGRLDRSRPRDCRVARLSHPAIASRWSMPGMVQGRPSMGNHWKSHWSGDCAEPRLDASCLRIVRRRSRRKLREGEGQAVAPDLRVRCCSHEPGDLPVDIEPRGTGCSALGQQSRCRGTPVYGGDCAVRRTRRSEAFTAYLTRELSS